MSTTDPTYGVSIANALTGFTVLTEDINDAVQTYEVRNEVNKLVNKVKYDTLTTLTLSLEGGAAAPATAGHTFTYGGVDYVCESVKKTGSFSDKTKWSVTATRGANQIVEAAAVVAE